MDLRRATRRARVGARRRREHLEQRADALEPEDDVAANSRSCSRWSLAAATACGPGCSGTGRVVAAANGLADHLAEQRPLVAEAGVDGLGRDAGLGGDGGDRRALEATLDEQPRRRREHAPARLLGLLAAALRAVRHDAA